MKNKLEKRVLARLDKRSPRKKRYNFTLSPHMKEGFSSWCKEEGRKESPVVEALILEMIPKKIFQ